MLPPQPHMITCRWQRPRGAGLRRGVTYNFEPVPTDVEAGRDGRCTSRRSPAGRKAPRLSAARQRLAARRDGHHLARLATGFDGATNLAITTSGRILVAELFAGRISTIAHGKPAPVLDLPGVASVEFTATPCTPARTGRRTRTGPTGNGKVVKISVRW